MNATSNFGTDDLIGHLAAIYGQREAGEIVKHIDALVLQYRRAARGIPTRPDLSEKDVALITYADTLRTEGVPPLRVLLDFHEQYLKGVFDVVHILPFQPYTSDDGFAVVDYHAVRSDLGDWEDVSRLSRVCSVMADAVVNHMSSEAPWFLGFLENDSDYAEYFVEEDPNADLSDVVRPRTSPLLTPFKDTDGRDRHVWTTFSADQVDLNYRNSEVLLAIVEVLFFIISKGVRLIRLDAVTFLWKERGTSCANLPETHRLIKIMRAAIAKLRTDVVVITETNVPHHENIAYFGNGHDEAHVVYNFALPPLIAHSFITGNAEKLCGWAKTLELPSDHVCFLNFSASHDGVGVRPVEAILDESELQGLVDAARAAGGQVSSRAMGDGRERPYELNCTFLDLISGGTDDDTLVSRFVASQAIVLAMPGVPAVYIQSLLGTRNDIELAQQTGRARSINRSQHDFEAVKAKLAAKESLESRVFEALTKLIRIRREHAAFHPTAKFEIVDTGAPEVFALSRQASNMDTAILCLFNVSDREVSVEIPAYFAGQDLLTGSSVVSGDHHLEPYAVRWLEAKDQGR